MFTNIQPITAFAATLMSITLGFGSTASANHHDHIDRVAVRVQKNAQRLLEETKHYRDAPGYRQLVHQTRQLRDAAIHIHDVTHFEGHTPHLRRDVALIDQSFHQLEDLFYHIEAEVQRGRCHLDVNTNRFKRKMKQLEREIHNLGDDLAKICAVPQVVQRPPYRYEAPRATAVQTFGRNYNVHQGGFQTGQYVPSNRNYHDNRYQGHRGADYHDRHRSNVARTARGISIGGGSTRIWIGF